MGNIVILNKNKRNIIGGIQQSIINSGVKTLDFSEISEISKISKISDILFFSGGQEQKTIIKTLKLLPDGCKIGWWMCDFRDPSYFDKVLFGKFDFIFLPHKVNHNGFKKMVKQSVHYMPQSGFKYNFDENLEINFDLIFIGNPYSNIYHRSRPEILNKINNNFNLKIINGNTTTIEQSTIYEKTPISISISEPHMIGGTSNRLYNILASGGFALVKYFEGIELLFENKKHIVWFKNNDELVDIIHYYLNNPKKITEIKKNAKDLFLKKHTGKVRVDNIFNIISGKDKTFSGYLNYDKNI